MAISIDDINYLIKGYIINNIKKLFNIRLYTDKQDVIFNDAKIGDQIFCMMPLKPIEYIKIKKGHRNRPYVIVAKDDNFFVWILLHYASWEKFNSMC